jgi:type III secretion system FlhB-like substrate exporter
MSKPELAVGVRYLPSYPAPLILFKARGHQARLVLDLARRYDIPESSDEILAPLLFQLPEGSWIPEKHFAVLAQLLAAVYHGKET